ASESEESAKFLGQFVAVSAQRHRFDLAKGEPRHFSWLREIQHLGRQAIADRGDSVNRQRRGDRGKQERRRSFRSEESPDPNQQDDRDRGEVEFAGGAKSGRDTGSKKPPGSATFRSYLESDNRVTGQTKESTGTTDRV